MNTMDLDNANMNNNMNNINNDTRNIEIKIKKYFLY